LIHVTEEISVILYIVVTKAMLTLTADADEFCGVNTAPLQGGEKMKKVALLIGAFLCFICLMGSCAPTVTSMRVPVTYQPQGILKYRYPKLNVRLLEVKDTRHELQGGRTLPTLVFTPQGTSVAESHSRGRTTIENYEILNDALKEELTAAEIKVIYGKENVTLTPELDIAIDLNYLATYKSMGGKSKIVQLMTNVKVRDAKTKEVLLGRQVTSKKYGKELQTLYQDAVESFVSDLLGSDDMQNILAKYR
jgi:hypothetical protein